MEETYFVQFESSHIFPYVTIKQSCCRDFYIEHFFLVILQNMLDIPWGSLVVGFVVVSVIIIAIV